MNTYCWVTAHWLKQHDQIKQHFESDVSNIIFVQVIFANHLGSRVIHSSVEFLCICSYVLNIQTKLSVFIQHTRRQKWTLNPPCKGSGLFIMKTTRKNQILVRHDKISSVPTGLEDKNIIIDVNVVHNKEDGTTGGMCFTFGHFSVWCFIVQYYIICFYYDLVLQCF